MTHACRGTISLHGALIHAEDSCTFVISNGGTQTFHIKAANEVDKQRWLTALELAKAISTHTLESGELHNIVADMCETLRFEGFEVQCKQCALRAESFVLKNLPSCIQIIGVVQPM
jgi:hypothetical protein